MLSELKRDFITKTLKIGTRGSPLALAQAYEVKKKISQSSGLSDDCIDIITINTKGDKIQDRPLTEIGGKGLFTEEIESRSGLYFQPPTTIINSKKIIKLISKPTGI